MPDFDVLFSLLDIEKRKKKHNKKQNKKKNKKKKKKKNDPMVRGKTGILNENIKLP